MAEIPRKFRFDKEHNQLKEIRWVLESNEVYRIVNMGFGKEEYNLYTGAICDEGAWGDTSAKPDQRPDVFSDKYKIMIEFMNVDCEVLEENGKPRCPNSESIGRSMRDLGDKYDFTGVDDMCVIAVPSNPNMASTDTYPNYLQAFKRVVLNHKEKIQEYRAEHPGFKLGFAIMDYTQNYYSCDSEEDVRCFKRKEPAK